MRKLLAVAVISGMLMLAPSGVAADPAGPGSERDTSEQTDGAAGVDPSDYEALRDEVVSRVLAQDPRFADLPDFERRAALASSNFDLTLLWTSGYYRVLQTIASQFSPSLFELGYAANWLVEVTLVDRCAEVAQGSGPGDDSAPLPDPCEWRHSWFYRVQPDGTVSLLFEEGQSDRGAPGEPG